MKIAIIGCGNMGGAIARGLAADAAFMSNNTIAVSNPSLGKLQAMPSIVATTTSNSEVVADADIVMIAVKPWLVDRVASAIHQHLERDAIIVSIAAGVPFSHLQELMPGKTLFRVIPNTAIAIGESMTAVAHNNASVEQQTAIIAIFDRLGKAVMVEERLMGAATALGSCGTAYALRYIRAAMEAGVELGLYPSQAQSIVAQTVKGAACLLIEGGNHPEQEIDKVTTPGGITIKGLNRMEALGFSSAVIEGIKASAK